MIHNILQCSMLIRNNGSALKEQVDRQVSHIDVCGAHSRGSCLFDGYVIPTQAWLSFLNMLQTLYLENYFSGWMPPLCSTYTSTQITTMKNGRAALSIKQPKHGDTYPAVEWPELGDWGHSQQAPSAALAAHRLISNGHLKNIFHFRYTSIGFFVIWKRCII
jgi:hypothetical protein